MRHSIWVVAGRWMQTYQHRPQETFLIGVVNVASVVYFGVSIKLLPCIGRYCDTYYKSHNALDHKITAAWLPAVALRRQFADNGVEIHVFSCVGILRSCREICWHPHCLHFPAGDSQWRPLWCQREWTWHTIFIASLAQNAILLNESATLYCAEKVVMGMDWAN